jgi:hypothetical protein
MTIASADVLSGHLKPLCPRDSEEPGINTEKCPIHDRWLYRRHSIDVEPGVRWCCGVEGCDYGYDAKTKKDSGFRPRRQARFFASL